MRVRDTVADMAAAFELPEEAVSGDARISLSRRQAMVENHAGLLGYSEEAVELRAGRGRVRILGSGLRLLAMDRDTLIVTGRISGVEYA